MRHDKTVQSASCLAWRRCKLAAEATTLGGGGAGLTARRTCRARHRPTPSDERLVAGDAPTPDADVRLARSRRPPASRLQDRCPRGRRRIAGARRGHQAAQVVGTDALDGRAASRWLVRAGGQLLSTHNHMPSLRRKPLRRKLDIASRNAKLRKTNSGHKHGPDTNPRMSYFTKLNAVVNVGCTVYS